MECSLIGQLSQPAGTSATRRLRMPWSADVGRSREFFNGIESLIFRDSGGEEI